MADGITVNVHIDERALQAKLDNLLDKKTMLEVHNALARYCEPYVPMQSGLLATTHQVTPDFVRYYLPYAHYQYTGDVYGPNIPIKDKDGNIVGFFSPPGQKKHPTGAQLKYSTEMHPRASKEWDKAMMADNGQAFIEEVKRILVERARELYG